MNVWFEHNDNLDQRCMHCREPIELGSLTMMVSRTNKARRQAHPFHPHCFAPFVEKIYNIKQRVEGKGTRDVRKNLSNKLIYFAKKYYKLADQAPLSDWDKIQLYTYRIKSRALYNELLKNGGPFRFTGHDSILVTNKPLWYPDDSEYEEWEGVNVKQIYDHIDEKDSI